MCQPVVAHCPVVAFNVSVLLRLSWLNELNMDTSLFSPCQRHTADVFRPVVAADHQRLAAPLNDLIERTYDTLGRQREVHLDTQTFPVEIVDHVKQPNAAPVAQLVVHEVHRPNLVDRRRNRQRQWAFAYQALARLYPQVQLQRPIDPIDALVVPLKALHVAQIQEVRFPRQTGHPFHAKLDTDSTANWTLVPAQTGH